MAAESHPSSPGAQAAQSGRPTGGHRAGRERSFRIPHPGWGRRGSPAGAAGDRVSTVAAAGRPHAEWDPSTARPHHPRGRGSPGAGSAGTSLRRRPRLCSGTTRRSAQFPTLITPRKIKPGRQAKAGRAGAAPAPARRLPPSGPHRPGMCAATRPRPGGRWAGGAVPPGPGPRPAALRSGSPAAALVAGAGR